MRLVLAAVALMYISTSLRAQSDTLRLRPHHQFKVTAATAFGYWKDISFSPLNYHSQGTVYQTGYIRDNRSATALFRATINFGTGQVAPVRSDLALFNSEYIAGDLTIGYLKLVPEKFEKLRLLVGPSVPT